MAMFGPRIYAQAEPNFSGLFRLIDEFDNYALSQANGRPHHGRRRGRHQIPTFSPKFDMRETEADYELHGELPGIEKDQIHIEFTDPQTIVIRGRVERTRTSGTPPAGLIEEDSSPKMSGALTQDGEQSSEAGKDRRSSFHATVEDDTEEDGSTATGTAAQTPASTSAEVAKPAPTQQAPEQPKHKYWISERSVGEFSRSFQFPGRIESDNVSASLNNGVLTVTVPKAKKYESRRIAIN
ncbi:hypothetical protein DL766_008653 [Monosporascus sp. MC13-8B]|uniref:SHSP domain-containing protein n=1 Tax=Monosporascus cannonballus TaxID=155416 RepID=A0ABY0GVI4_9PEZI|nr:hypothetical protein DL762_008685 [Monosporascus cannonballus]RYO78892.1 hypothetical protein DL763_009477 [Monosporascus cannonballus]RYP18499.1 hypothetical protein DL766_008653 [Monosporascus sp. MC13-8B]